MLSNPFKIKAPALGTAKTLLVGDTAKTPLVGGTTKTPLIGGTTKTPLIGGTTKTPLLVPETGAPLKSAPPSKTVADLASAALWIALSAGVIMFNKYILSVLKFACPITLTMWHMLFSSTLAAALVHTGVVDRPDISTDAFISAVVPIGALFAGTLWLGNAAYVYLSVSFIQMLKALMPAAVFAVGCAMGTEKFSWTTTACIAVITGGVALASVGEVNFVPVGVLLQLASLATESTRLTLIQILLQRRGLKLNPITTLYYLAPVSLACLCVPWYVFESARVLGGGTVWPPAAVLLANAATAFALNLAVFVLVGRTSALTMNLAGVVKDWLLIGLSAAVFGAAVTRVNLMGYSIAFAGVLWHNRAKFVSGRKA